MSDQQPETGEAIPLQAEYIRDDFGVKVTVSLGEATITVEHAWEDTAGGATDALNLIQVLPEILHRTHEAIAADTTTQEEA